jgi:hypothetical protein
MEFEREEEDAAAEEASRIGGDPYQHAPGEGDPLDYAEEDSRPAGQTAESWRAVEEGGGGEAELVERAENPHGPSPIADAEDVEEEEAALDPEYGEADDVHTSEDDPDERSDF